MQPVERVEEQYTFVHSLTYNSNEDQNCANKLVLKTSNTDPWFGDPYYKYHCPSQDELNEFMKLTENGPISYYYTGRTLYTTVFQSLDHVIVTKKL